MSKPMTPEQFLKQLDKWKVNYDVYKSNWKTHNRNSIEPFVNVNGIMQHHTGADNTSLDTLYNGYSSLPGPLCQVGNDKNGKLWIIGWGRCNHAGKGDPSVFNKVVSENYTGVLVPRTNSMDGNSRFYGIETIYSGSVFMNDKQLNTAVLFSCATSDFHKWNEKSTIGHGEWQSGKWDPGIRRGVMYPMDKFRGFIAEQLKKGPVVSKPKTTTNYHTVTSGDTLYGLAKRYLGDSNRWPEFVRENPHVIDLSLGMKVKIPKK